LIEITFYATAMIESPGDVKAVDARTIDTLNLALIFGVPIFVDQAGHATVLITNEAPPPESKARWAAMMSDDRTEGREEIVAALRPRRPCRLRSGFEE
jgi:bifunctional DNase/RNase